MRREQGNRGLTFATMAGRYVHSLCMAADRDRRSTRLGLDAALTCTSPVDMATYCQCVQAALECDEFTIAGAMVLVDLLNAQARDLFTRQAALKIFGVLLSLSMKLGDDWASARPCVAGTLWMSREDLSACERHVLQRLRYRCFVNPWMADIYVDMFDSAYRAGVLMLAAK